MPRAEVGHPLKHPRQVRAERSGIEPLVAERFTLRVFGFGDAVAHHNDPRAGSKRNVAHRVFGLGEEAYRETSFCSSRETPASEHNLGITWPQFRYSSVPS